MNDTVKQIVGVLEGGRPELQIAAAQILGELQVKDAAVVKALAGSAARSPVLGRYVLEALARIGSTEALRVVVHALIEHESLVDQASHLLAESGRAAHGPIGEAFAEAPPDRRIRLLQVLAREPSKQSVEAFVHALAAAETCDEAATFVVDAVEDMDDAVRKGLRDALVKAMEQPLPETSLAAMLGVVAHVDPNGGKAVLMQHIGEKSPPALRQAALEALAGQQLTALQAKGLLAQLEDAQHQALHDSIRRVLTAMPKWPDGLAAPLKRLLASRNQEQRLFALRAMKSSPTPELIKLALKLRDHDDPRFRAAAEDVLGTSKHAIEPVLRLLQLAKDPVDARRLGGILGRLGSLLGPKHVRSIAERATKLLPQKALIADLMLDVALASAGQKIVPFLLDKALRWRRSRRFAEALHVLARLAAADLLDDEGRYQLAATRFLQDAARPNVEDDTPGNPAMGFFTVLLRAGFPLMERLKKDTSMQPEHMLKLATYFADTVGPERRFGQDLLQHLAQRHKGRTGEEARHALRAVGY
ncbi:MAG: hypothetical protein AB7O97_15585 [Planctomycetota bacterium]